jgi:AmmeMemoRadiSam system protein B
MIRETAVAGRFYPGNADDLKKQVREFTSSETPKIRAVGSVIPHAGYMYSGHVAGAVYARIQIPLRAIVLCPNHTGLGSALSIMTSGSWETPLGNVEVDEEISDALISADPDLRHDSAAHRYEHAIEVQLPFLRSIAGPAFRFVPITVGTADWRNLETLGNAIAQVIRDIESITIIASSDMNHYESDAITRVKDRKAINQVLALDARGLYSVVRQERISMCGFGPATAMLIAARQLGASKAELIKYATSADVSGDFERVVGYAGIAVM